MPNLPEKHIARTFLEARATFASYLETARALYRKYPDLILAEQFPKPWADAIREFYGCEANDHDLNIGFVDDDLWLSPNLEEPFRAEQIRDLAELAER